MSGHPFHAASAAAVIVSGLPVRAGMGFRSMLITIHLIVISSLLAIWQPVVYAQTIEPAMALVHQIQAVRTYNIPAGPLEAALARFISESGVPLAATPELVQGKQSSGIRGTFSVQAALDILLAGTGLEAQLNAQGQYRLREAEGSITTLPLMTVSASTEPQLGELPPAYAGGQVATGMQLGLLGNHDVMDTPFNVTSYTSEFIDNKQATVLHDVFVNDPSIRSTGPRAYDNFYVRGFASSRGESLFLGLYGISNILGNELQYIERIDVLKGPSTFLNGAVGLNNATINFIPKRAEQTPLIQVKLNYMSDSNFGAHADVGRRFGEDDAFGIRVNVAHRDGNLARDNESERASAAAIGLDYRKSNVLVSLDAGFNNRKTNGSAYFIAVDPSTPYPNAPNGRNNLYQPWHYDDLSYYFGVLRGELALSDNWKIHGTFGYARSVWDSLWGYGNVLSANGDTELSSSIFLRKFTTLSGQTGINGDFYTGSIRHAVAFNFDRGERKSYGTFEYSDDTALTNIYDPVSFSPPFLPRIDRNTPKLNSSQWESFAFSDTLSFLKDRIQVTLGLRHQTFISYGFDADNGDKTSRYKKSKVTPAVAFIAKPIMNLSLYGNYVEGLVEGGSAPLQFEGVTVANANEILPLSTTRQMEVGMKYDFGRLTTTLSLFDIRRPQYVFNRVSRIYGADGQQRNRGIELQFLGTPLEGFRLLGGIMLLDPVLTKTQDGLFDGKKALRTSHTLVNLGGEVDVPWIKNLTLIGSVIYTSALYQDHERMQRVDPWTRFDAGLRYKAGRTVLRADVENVTGEKYWVYGQFGRPRALRLSVAMDF